MKMKRIVQGQEIRKAGQSGILHRNGSAVRFGWS